MKLHPPIKGRTLFLRSWQRRGRRMNVDHEVAELIKEIQRLGTQGPDGKYSVKYLNFVCFCLFFLKNKPSISPIGLWSFAYKSLKDLRVGHPDGNY